MFSLASRLGESDPRKIASLPADILLLWQAYFELHDDETPKAEVHPDPAASRSPETDQQCADVMRMILR